MPPIIKPNVFQKPATGRPARTESTASRDSPSRQPAQSTGCYERAPLHTCTCCRGGHSPGLTVAARRHPADGYAAARRSRGSSKVRSAISRASS
jgi:hypothetical protein